MESEEAGPGEVGIKAGKTNVASSWRDVNSRSKTLGFIMLNVDDPHYSGIQCL